MNLAEEQCIEDLADLLYNFLPGSRNSRSLSDYWRVISIARQSG